MSSPTIDQLAKIVWDFMLMHEQPVKSDVIFCLGSHDTRVAIRASDLMLQNYGKYLVFSGGSGRLTKDIFSEAEAVIFRNIAVERGVDPEKILIEPESTNTGENIRFTYDLLQRSRLPVSSLLLVQKPYMERRAYATFKKQWPDPTTSITVTSPQLSFEEYVSEGIPKEDVINIMVGDLQRIKEYPKLGLQIEQLIPSQVIDAYNALVAAGFTRHLLSKSTEAANQNVQSS